MYLFKIVWDRDQLVFEKKIEELKNDKDVEWIDNGHPIVITNTYNPDTKQIVYSWAKEFTGIPKEKTIKA